MENRIKEVIKDKGIKQKWLAEKIGVSETDISSYIVAPHEMHIPH